MYFLIQVFGFIILVILQLAVVANVPLLHGAADLLLLWVAAWSLLSKGQSAWVYAGASAIAVAFVSAINPAVPIITYLGVVLVARFFQKRIWQSPFMALMIVSFLGSILESALSIMTLFIEGIPFSLNESLVQVIIPTLFLNLLLALPVYVICRDYHHWLYPYEVEI